MDPRQEFMRLPALDDADFVGVGGRVFVAEPAVADEMGTGCCGSADETVQRFRRSVGDLRHPDSAGMAVL